MSAFTLGVNLPWLRYGGDFGRSAWHPKGGISQEGGSRRLDDIFRRLGDHSLHQIRWFLLGDGRAGLVPSDSGLPAGIDESLFSDMDVALERAELHQVRVVFTLIDFMWFYPARYLNGVMMGGRSRAVTGRRERERFLDTVLTPIFERYGRSEAIRAWDVINEPDWVTSARKRQLRGFVGEVAERVHAMTQHEVTVGLARALSLSLVRDLPLDWIQVHWYDAQERESPLERSVAALGVDRAVVLGEFPTRNSAQSPEEILETVKQAGYSGAFAWSMLAEDDASDFSRFAAAIGGSRQACVPRAQLL